MSDIKTIESTPAPKILLVDDEPRVLRSLNAVLKSKYHILTAANATDAREILLAEKDVAVIVADERMPEQMGHELLIWTKEHFPYCSRVLMTGHCEMEALKDFIKEADIFCYLTKPWDCKELTEILDNAVLLSMANINICSEQAKAQKQKIKEYCIAVMDVEQEKNSVYKEVARAQGLPIKFFDKVEKLMIHLFYSADIGLIFIDTNIGVKNVVEIVRQIHSKYPHVVIITVTEASRGEEAMAMLNKGQIFKCLVKPITITRMKPMITAFKEKFEQNRNQYMGNDNSHDEDHNTSHIWHKITQLWS